MCTVLLPPGDKSIAVNKYIISSSGEVQNEWSYICSSSLCIRIMDRYNNTFILLFTLYNKGTLDGSQWMDVRDYKHCVQTVSGGGGGVLTSSV